MRFRPETRAGSERAVPLRVRLGRQRNRMVVSIRSNTKILHIASPAVPHIQGNQRRLGDSRPLQSPMTAAQRSTVGFDFLGSQANVIA